MYVLIQASRRQALQRGDVLSAQDPVMQLGERKAKSIKIGEIEWCLESGKWNHEILSFNVCLPRLGQLNFFGLARNLGREDRNYFRKFSNTGALQRLL